MSEHEKHFVGPIMVPEFGCPECAARQGSAAVDWPARFRTAADVAEKADHEGASWLLGEFADMATEDLPPHVVEAIGRALLGEDGGQDR